MVGTYIGFGVLQAFGGASNPVLPIVGAPGRDDAGGDGRLRHPRRRDRTLRVPAAAGRAPIAPLISALGVSFFLAYSMQLLFGAQQRNYETFSLSGGALYFKGFHIGGVRVPLLRTSSSSSAFMLMGILWFLVNKTRTGKAMRATSFDREAAAMMGIDIDRVIVFTFILGSALAGAAGVLFALRVPTQVSLGFVAGLKGFTAAVIGGIGSVPGAMAGGLILGAAESYAAGYIPGQAGTRWTDLVIFSILILFMIFRPQGLFGRADIRKV